MFLTREETALLTREQCEKHYKKIAKTYNLDMPLHKCWEQVWPDLDQIVDTLLYLEDHIKHLELSEQMTQTMTARWADKKAAE
jgi:hypothetical protein